MKDTLKLMEYLQANGHGLTLKGENLRIMRGKHLPPSLREEITAHKKAILSIFKCDEEAKAAHFIVGIPGTMYMRTVNRFSTVYLEYDGERWEAWRETYQQGRIASSSFKTIVPPSSFGAALAEVEKYLQYYERKNNHRNEKWYR